MGKSLRDTCARESRADWKPPSDRPDLIKLLEHSSKRRMAELIPIRFGRERHLSRLDHGQERPRFLCSAVAGHEAQSAGREVFTLSQMNDYGMLWLV